MPALARTLAPLAVVALLAPAARASAQASAPPEPAPPAAARPAAPAFTGAWTGTLRAGPIAARLVLAIEPGADGRAGTARIVPDAGRPELSGDVRDLVAGPAEVTFSVATQEGTLRFAGAPDGAGGLRGRLTVTDDGGAVQARGVWAATADRARAAR